MERWFRPMTVTGAFFLQLVAFGVILLSIRLAALIAADLGILPAAQAVHKVASDPFCLGAATAAGVGCALLAGRVWHAPRAPWSSLLALRPVRGATPLLALAAGLSLQFPLTELQNIAEIYAPISPEQKQEIYQMLSPADWRQVIGSVTALVLAAPICEELLFRGLILQGLYQRHSALFAVSISSIFFGLSHIRLTASILPAMVAGLILGAIALRTGSILSSMVLHASINAAPLLLPAQVMRLPGFNVAQTHASHLSPVLLLTACAVAAAALAILWKTGSRIGAVEAQ